MDVLDGVVTTARAAAALVLPARCAGCGAPGRAWCAGCAVATRRPAPPAAPGRDPPTWSATVLEGPVRLAVTAHKDEGRADVRDVLARLLAAALVRALAEDPVVRAARARGATVLVVPVPAAPAARRRRGGDPVALLAVRAAALADPGLAVVPALGHARRVADQAGLGAAARRANLDGALRVRARSREAVAGRPCVLVDDVVTTGATLADGARALRSAGSSQVVAATAAATPSRPRETSHFWL